MYLVLQYGRTTIRWFSIPNAIVIIQVFITNLIPFCQNNRGRQHFDGTVYWQPGVPFTHTEKSLL